MYESENIPAPLYKGSVFIGIPEETNSFRWCFLVSVAALVFA